MGAARFEQGATVLLATVSHRVIRKVSDDEWQLEDCRTKRITTLTQATIRARLADGTLRFPGSDLIVRSGGADSELTGKQFEIAKLRRHYVLAVEHVPNTRKSFDVAIDHAWAHAKNSPKRPSSSSVYLWKRRHLAARGDIRALVDNHCAKGRRGSRYCREVSEICSAAIDARYMTRERPTIQVVADEAAFRVAQENKLRPSSHKLPIPTPRFIRRLIAAIPDYDKCSARFGPEYARRQFRSVKGAIACDAPLERAEIDHTQLDVFVLDDVSLLPLGRPWVTICIDVYTRCILCIYIGFNPPSYRTVAACLKNSFLPKVTLGEDYPDVKCDWPSYGVMQNLVVDGGREFTGKDLEQVCLSLNITLHQSPRRQPWCKPMVERFFGTLNRGLAHNLPGTTFSNIFEKGDYDPEKHAVITLAGLQSALMKYIADVYHQQRHRGIDATPYEMWNQTVKMEDIRVPDETTELEAIMGRSVERVLDHKGIDLEGLRYNSEELTQLRHRHGSRLKVQIRVDESDLGSIYILSPFDTSVLRVPCLNQKYAKGISSWQHLVFRAHQRRSNSLPASPMAWLQAKRDIQVLVELALSKGVRKLGKRAGRFLEDQRKNRPLEKSPLPRSEPMIQSSGESDGFAMDLDSVPTSPISECTNLGITTGQARPKLIPIYRKELGRDD